jgi:hypothetical protein
LPSQRDVLEVPSVLDVSPIAVTEFDRLMFEIGPKSEVLSTTNVGGKIDAKEHSDVKTPLHSRVSTSRRLGAEKETDICKY